MQGIERSEQQRPGPEEIEEEVRREQERMEQERMEQERLEQERLEQRGWSKRGWQVRDSDKAIAQMPDGASKQSTN